VPKPGYIGLNNHRSSKPANEGVHEMGKKLYGGGGGGGGGWNRRY
jgi:hypothetical protein